MLRRSAGSRRQAVLKDGFGAKECENFAANRPLHFSTLKSYSYCGFTVANVRSIKNGSWNIEGTGVNQGCSGCSLKHRGDSSSTVEILGSTCKTARRTSDSKRKSTWMDVLRWLTVGIHIIYGPVCPYIHIVFFFFYSSKS